MLRHLLFCLLSRPPAPLFLIDSELAEKIRSETYFVWFALLYLLPSSPTCPYCSTVKFLATESQIVWTSQFPSKSCPSNAASPAELFGNWKHCSMFSHGFPLLWRKAFGLVGKVDHRGCPFHRAYCSSCFGSLQLIGRRKSYYPLLTKKLFHNMESFERVSLCSCLQSRLKYVALHNLTRWQFASMYFFYFHCWILCTLCYEELGIEITNSERDTVKYWKHGGKKHRWNMLMRAM